jgi:hypothetical protein
MVTLTNFYSNIGVSGLIFIKLVKQLKRWRYYNEKFKQYTNVYNGRTRFK